MLSLYALLAMVYLYPACLSPADTLPSLPNSDASQALWALENYELLGDTFIDKAFPPRGVEYGYIHWMAAPLLLGQIVLNVLSPIGTYNFLLFLGIVGSCYGANRLARSQGVGQPGAWVAGLGYGLCPMLAGQIMAGHLFYVFGAIFVPLYLLTLIHFVRTERKLILGILVVVLWLLMMRSCIYYCLFLIPLSFLVVAYEGLKQSQRPIRPALVLMVAGILGSLLALSQSQATSDTALLMPRVNMEMFGSDLLAAFTPSPYHPLWGELFPRPGDAVGFCGFTLLSLFAVSLWKKPSRSSAALCLVAWLVALGPVLYLGGHRLVEIPWSGVFSLPGYEGVQVYARAMLIVQLLIAVVAVRILESWRNSVLVTILILCEFWIGPVAVHRGSEAEIFRQLLNEPNGTVLSIPYNAANTQALFHQTLHKKTILRAPVLRPSTELVHFYEQFRWLERFSSPRGSENFPKVDLSTFALLTKLRYFSLDKSRLSPSDRKNWTEWIGEHCLIKQRWENDSYLLLAIQAPLPKFHYIEIDFSKPEQGYCSWGLAPHDENAKSSLRLAQSQRIEVWLPISELNSFELELSGIDQSASGAQVFWNDEFLGPILWTKRERTKKHGNRRLQTSLFKIPPEISRVGANRLTIALPKKTTASYTSFGLSKLRLFSR